MSSDTLERVIPVTIQDGKVMKYLNMRIIQTHKGISINQTHHIKTTLLHSNKIVWILLWILSMILSNPYNIHESHFPCQYPSWPIFGSNIHVISTESSALCNIHVKFYKNEKFTRNPAVSTAIYTFAVG